MLCGFMGTGKSRLASEIARLFQGSVVDTDQEIAARLKMTPGEAIRSLGEAKFREVEREAVRAVSQRRSTVIATGGGVPLDPRNLDALGETGILFLLEARPATLVRRLQQDGDRPLLKGVDEASIRRQLCERASAYSAVPNRVSTDQRAPEDLAREVYTRFVRLARSQNSQRNGMEDDSL